MLITNKPIFSILNYNNFYVDECKFGKGIFARKNIKKGDLILKFTGQLINFKQTLDKEQDFGYPLQVGKDLYIDLEKPGRFINHSCAPNAGIQNNVSLIALADIRKDEEIYFDYSTSMDEDYWTMECQCGNHNCRATIKDFKHLPYQLKDKYLQQKIVQKFIASQYQQIATV